MRHLTIIFICILLVSSCEEAFIPDIQEESRKIIVEGHIEHGSNVLPPYVLISRSLPFFGTISQEDLTETQITDAEVYVVHEGDTSSLDLICLSDLPPEVREELIGQINIIPGNPETDFCVYMDLSFAISINIGDLYHLIINLPNGEVLTSVTSIPEHVPVSDFRFTPPPGNLQTDTLARLLCRINDPENESNYYRYLTAENNGPFIAGFSSVIDDAFFNGESFEFPLQKAESPQAGEDVDPNTFGLYDRGDTVRIKWMNLDEAHFEFWNTFEFNLNNQGPFSTYTRVSSNVDGAIGIWGGYSSTTYTLIVPEE